MLVWKYWPRCKKKKIRTFQDRYMATVTGDIEDVNGVLKITRIHVH
jgi:hypothetical protein